MLIHFRRMVRCIPRPALTLRVALMLMIVFASLPLIATDASPETDGKTAESTVISNQDSLRSFLEIQEQLHNTQLAIEKNRQETEIAFASNSQILQARLARMEADRLDALKEMQHGDKMLLIAAGAFLALGFLVLITSAWLQMSSIRRLSSMASQLSVPQTLQHMSLGDGHLLASQAMEQSNARFLAMIERLEKRLLEVEATAQSARQISDGDLPADGTLALPEGSGSKVNMLLGKGQTLLKLDKAEAALDCLNEVLAIDPVNPDALIRKGAALERLSRFNEAVACYDQAIAHDASMTMAYLYKGAVFNRMERYSEALECYEQALKTRQKNGQAANVIFD
jgi:tetratricopeptide (TPR) repeat protein